MKTRHRWMNRKVFLADTVAMLLAFHGSWMAQGVNRFLEQSLGGGWLPLIVLAYYLFGELATVLSGGIINWVNAKRFAVAMMSVMAGSVIIIANATTPQWLLAGYSIYTASHFLGFTAIATICRMSLNSDPNLHRRGVSFYGGYCYLGGAGAGYAINLVLSDDMYRWNLIAVTTALIGIFLLLFVKLPQEMNEEVTSNRKSFTPLGFWHQLFDTRAIRVIWPYACIIAGNTILINYLQFSLEAGADWVLTLYYLTCAFAGAVPVRTAERKNDWVVSLLSYVAAGGSMGCFFIGGLTLSVVGVVLLGLAIGMGRVSASQLGYMEAGLTGRGVAAFYESGIKIGQIVGAFLGLLRPFIGDNLIWISPLPLLILAIVYTAWQKKQRFTAEK